MSRYTQEMIESLNLQQYTIVVNNVYTKFYKDTCN